MEKDRMFYYDNIKSNIEENQQIIENIMTANKKVKVRIITKELLFTERINNYRTNEKSKIIRERIFKTENIRTFNKLVFYIRNEINQIAKRDNVFLEYVPYLIVENKRLEITAKSRTYNYKATEL